MTARFFSWKTYCNRVSYLFFVPTVMSLAHLAQKPSNQVAKNNGLVCFRVIGRRRNARHGPQVAFPLIEVSVGSAGVEQQDSRSAINKPSTVESLDASVFHRLDGSDQGRVLGFNHLNLDGGLFRCQPCLDPLLFVDDRGGPYRISIERSQQCVCRAVFGSRDLSFGLEDRVDTTN